MVQQVGQNIARAVETYFANQGQKDVLQGYQWEFKLVKDPQVNAFALPGGKVVVYTGLLDVATTPAQLAVVLSHEIAHAVAKHGAEKMSQALVQQMGGVALSTALRSQPQLTQQLFMASYGVGSQVGYSLPFSRKMESEADHLGLDFMAMAGYNPQVAVEFWQKMEQQGGSQPPQFLSDHPSHGTRVKDIQAELPEAMKYYHGDQASGK
jgi:predicted Zn-dependent protease